MLNFFWKKELIDSQTLTQLLNRIISPRLAKRGLLWNEQYLWFSQPGEMITQVFRYSRLKGEVGTFTWGICLDFVPTLVSTKLKFHRTAKTVQPHLFEWTDEYANSFSGGELTGGITTHWGRKEAETSILKLIEKYEDKIFSWYDRASSIEKLIEIARQQTTTGGSYNLHHPDPKYVLAFLYARAGKREKARETIEQLDFDKEINDLLLNQIEKIMAEKNK